MDKGEHNKQPQRQQRIGAKWLCHIEYACGRFQKVYDGGKSMNVIERIKEIIFKIKDYDRLESDYCTCLCYFTNNKMSKPNYKIEVVKEVIIDSIGEYLDEGYDEATRKAIKWLKDNGSHYIDIVNGQLVLKKGIIKNFKKYMGDSL